VKKRLLVFLGLLPLFIGAEERQLQASPDTLFVEGEERQSGAPLNTFYPGLQNSNHLWVSSDMLFWTPKEKTIVATNQKTNLFTTSDVTLKPPLDTRFRWDFGSRVGLGYLFRNDVDSWDTMLHWTYYTSHTAKRSDTENNISEGSFPVWSLSSDIIAYDWVAKAKLSWKMNLNLLDLDFGRAFSFRWFHLRPFVGLRSAWIGQKIHAVYGGGIFVNGPDLYLMSNNAGYDEVRMKNNYWGVGPLAGISPQADLGKGLRLYANASGSFSYGYFHLKQEEIYLQHVRYYRNHFPAAGRWILDVAGGISWSTLQDSAHYALTFTLGWEYHLFFHQFSLAKDAFGIVPDHRSLQVMGGVFSTRFAF
jgi:hypothetical protein